VSDILARMMIIWTGSGFAQLQWGHMLMLVVGITLITLAVKKGFEPLLLIPIGFGAILTNLPGSGIMDPTHGFLGQIYNAGTASEIFPIIMFLCLGALTDFKPLLANPVTFLLGAAAQGGVFVALVGAVALGFSVPAACAIGIIGGADGPTSIYLASKLAPEYLGAIAVASYSYMSLVPLIQPPVIRLLTTKKERSIEMKATREVSRTELVVFPVVVAILCGLLLPPAVPLIGMFMLGNFLRESHVVDRLVNTAQNEICNITTIFLGVTVGATMEADKFLQVATLKIISLGLVAFIFSTFFGVLFGKLMMVLSGGRINPIIGAAGVSAVPMAARTAHQEGQRANPRNFLLMHAMGPNVAGVIGTAVAAAVMLALLGG